ncbi:hypothetical protein FBU30_006167 [Linnemannia zychae]|nr:hypothetical protein FBU30_006167 [Linnemannia zychae]
MPLEGSFCDKDRLGNPLRRLELLPLRLVVVAMEEQEEGVGAGEDADELSGGGEGEEAFEGETEAALLLVVELLFRCGRRYYTKKCQKK